MKMKRAATQDKQLTGEQRAWIRCEHLLSGVGNPFTDPKEERQAFLKVNPEALRPMPKRSRKMLVMKTGEKEYFLPRAKGAN